MQDGGGRHLEKLKISNISGTDRPILVKFGKMTHTGPRNRTGSWNFQLLKIQDVGQPATWKSKIGHISGTVRPIFATMMYIGPPNGTGSWNFQFLKIQMARHKCEVIACLSNQTHCYIVYWIYCKINLIGNLIWYLTSEADSKLKFPTFKHSRWRTAAILKNGKIGHRTISINAMACSCQKRHISSRQKYNYMLRYLLYLFYVIKPQKNIKTKTGLSFSSL